MPFVWLDEPETEFLGALDGKLRVSSSECRDRGTFFETICFWVVDCGALCFEQDWLM